MNIYRFPLLLAVFLALLLTTTTGHSADTIGRADKVKNKVTGQLAGKRVKVKVGTQVYQNQRIRTGRGSSAQFRFKDDTRLAVGANASLVLDKAVFSSGSKSRLVLKAARGAFRFGSGNLRKKAYKIITPSSTVGVRGTLFDLFVGSRGETIITLLRGQVEACNQAGVCRAIKDPCNCLRIDRNGRFTSATSLTQRILRGTSASRAAPFLYFQRPLLRSLRAPKWVVRRCIDADQEEGHDTNGGGDTADSPGAPGGGHGSSGGGSSY